MLTSRITLQVSTILSYHHSAIYQNCFKNLSYCQTADDIQYCIAKTSHYHKQDEFSHAYYNAHKAKLECTFK